MIDFNRGNYETADGRSDCQTANSLPFSRRSFLAKTSYFGALYAAAKLLPMAAELAGDTRVSQTPLVDKGFASVRKMLNSSLSRDRSTRDRIRGRFGTVPYP